MTLVLALDVSYSCTNIFECFEQGNFDIQNWSGAVQFQVISLFILLILVTILLKEDLMNRFNMEGKTANLTAWVLIISLVLAVSFSQQSQSALQFVFLIAVLPMALLAYIVAGKVKGEENSWIGSFQGTISIILGVYVFLRLLTVFFGGLETLVDVIPFIGFVLGLSAANFLDIAVVGGILFLKHVHNKKLREGNYDNSRNRDSGNRRLFGWDKYFSNQRDVNSNHLDDNNTYKVAPVVSLSDIRAQNNSRIIDLIKAQSATIDSINRGIQSSEQLKPKVDQLSDEELKASLINILISVSKQLDTLSKIKVANIYPKAKNGSDIKSFSELNAGIIAISTQIKDADKDKLVRSLDDIKVALEMMRIYCVSVDTSVYGLNELKVIVKDIGSTMVSKNYYDLSLPFKAFSASLRNVIIGFDEADTYQNFLSLEKNLEKIDTLSYRDSQLIINIIQQI